MIKFVKLSLEYLKSNYCIFFFSRGGPGRRDNVHVLLDNYKCCQMYKDNGQLQKSTHRLSSTSIRNHPRKMQMTISDICSVMFV